MRCCSEIGLIIGSALAAPRHLVYILLTKEILCGISIRRRTFCRLMVRRQTAVLSNQTGRLSAMIRCWLTQTALSVAEWEVMSCRSLEPTKDMDYKIQEFR